MGVVAPGAKALTVLAPTLDTYKLPLLSKARPPGVFNPVRVVVGVVAPGAKRHSVTRTVPLSICTVATALGDVMVTSL